MDLFTDEEETAEEVDQITWSPDDLVELIVEIANWLYLADKPTRQKNQKKKKEDDTKPETKVVPGIDQTLVNYLRTTSGPDEAYRIVVQLKRQLRVLHGMLRQIATMPFESADMRRDRLTVEADRKARAEHKAFDDLTSKAQSDLVNQSLEKLEQEAEQKIKKEPLYVLDNLLSNKKPTHTTQFRRWIRHTIKILEPDNLMYAKSEGGRVKTTN